MKKLYTLLFIIAISSLVSCGKNSSANWDERFISLFNPTNEVIEQIKDGVQNIGIEMQYEDVVCYLGQIIGNEEILYLTLDFYYPDNVDISNNDFKIDISSDDIIFFKEANNIPQKISGSLILDNFSKHYENNSISCIVCFSPNYTFLKKGEEITMIIEAISIIEKQGNSKSYGPFEANWTINTSTPIKKYKIHDSENQEIGNVSLSAFKLDVELRESELNILSSKFKTVKIITNSETIIPEGFVSGDNHSFSLIFKNLIEIDKVDCIEIGNAKIDIN